MLLLVVLPITGGCLSALWRLSPSRVELDADRVVLPTENVEGLLLVEASINGIGPYVLVVDTGAQGLLVTRSIADAVGLRQDSGFAFRVVNAGGAWVGARSASVERIDIGGFHAEDLNAVVVPDEDFAPVRSILPVLDGVLGIGVFSRVVLEFDFPASRIAVERRGSRDLSSLPSVRYRGRVPVVTLELGDRRIPAILDTGSNFSLILQDEAGLPLAGTWVEEDGFGGAGLGAGALERGANAQVDGVVRLGPVSLVNPFVRRQAPGVRGNLGTEALQRLRLAIDTRARRIFFPGEPLVIHYPQLVPTDPARRAGAWLGIEGDSVRLLAVDTGGLFESAGFLEGDLVTHVSGQRAAGRFRMGSLATLLAGGVFRIEREGRMLELELPAPGAEGGDGLPEGDQESPAAQ